MLILCTLTGCWDRKELNSLAVVQAVGIDITNEGEISLTIQILKPVSVKASGKGDGTISDRRGVWVLNVKGKTVLDAFRNASKQADRKLFLSHNRVIIIGENAATLGVKPITDFFNRNFESRRTIDIFVAKGDARDILNVDNEQESIPAKAIERLVNEANNVSKAVKCNLQDFFSTSASKTSSVFMPGIEAIINESSGKKQLKLGQTAIFKEQKLIGWFDEKETRGLLWILGRVKTGTIVVQMPSEKEERKRVGIDIIRADTKLKPIIENNTLKIAILVNEEGDIGEVMSQEINLNKPDTINELEEKQKKVIEKEIKAALEKGQKIWGVDIFKFGEEFHHKYPKEWKELKKQWSDKYSKIEVKIEVDAELRRTGILINTE